MGKFLFIVPPLTGHINPTLGLGAGLLKNGHDVAWLSFDPALEKRIPAGGSFLLLETGMSEADKERMKHEMVELSKKNVYGLDSLKFLYEEVLVPMNTGMLEGIRKITDSYRPDVIINDHQIFAGTVVAIQEKVRYVTSVTAPAAIKVSESFPMIYSWEGEQIIQFQKKTGVEGETRLDCSSLLTLVYTSREFFGQSELPGYYKFVGPVINRNEQIDTFDWERFYEMGDRPGILVTIGTTFHHELKQSFFKKVIEAFENENITVVVVSDPALFESIPDNFIVCKQVPQLRLIPLIDAVVCHGGHNTVCETLSYAKPLVVLPIAYDQSYVAGCVVDSGAGIRLNFNRFRAPQLLDAVSTVLADKQYVENATTIQKSFEEAGGVDRAVKLLEQIIEQT